MAKARAVRPVCPPGTGGGRGAFSVLIFFSCSGFISSVFVFTLRVREVIFYRTYRTENNINRNVAFSILVFKNPCEPRTSV